MFAKLPEKLLDSGDVHVPAAWCFLAPSSCTYALCPARLLHHLPRPFAAGFEQLVASENASLRGRLNGGAMLATAPNERALLGCLLARLAGLDADVLVGHNIGAYELAVLLGCLQAHKVGWGRRGWLAGQQQQQVHLARYTCSAAGAGGLAVWLEQQQPAGGFVSTAVV
jgi:hypothetical protein